MSRTYDFVLNLARQFAPPPARLLDFGCGAGEIVARALTAGYDAHGADLYQGVWAQYRKGGSALGERLHLMTAPGELPFATAQFDIAVSNQVFEHIEKKPPVIAELARVIKPGGILIAVFPTREVMIEPHLKAPFVHWFAKHGRAQKTALEICARFGPARGDHAAWVRHATQSLAEDMFYLRDSDVPALFAGSFTLVHRGEAAFLRHRLAQPSRLQPLAALAAQKFAEPVLRALALRLANGVYVFSRKTEVENVPHPQQIKKIPVQP